MFNKKIKIKKYFVEKKSLIKINVRLTNEIISACFELTGTQRVDCRIMYACFEC